MTIELTPENAAALTKYAALAGCTPARFLNEYPADHMMPLFENPRTGGLESQLGNLKYRTQADAERVTAWMNHLLRERGVAASLKQKSKSDSK